MTTSHEHAETIASLTTNTVSALKDAQGKSDALQAVVKQFFKEASAANIEIEEIENILGVNEPSIMDLAELSEDDEEIVIDTFEQILNDQ